MNIGSLGVVSGLAGTAAQAAGAETLRARGEQAVQARQVQNAERTAEAEGIGRTDGEEHSANERDADGRRILEIGEQKRKPASHEQGQAPLSRDASGDAGRNLDLSI